MTDANITDLEVRITYLEDTLAQLDSVIARQTRQIDGIEAQNKLLNSRVRELLEATDGQDVIDEAPPHY